MGKVVSMITPTNATVRALAGPGAEREAHPLVGADPFEVVAMVITASVVYVAMWAAVIAPVYVVAHFICKFW